MQSRLISSLGLELQNIRDLHCSRINRYSDLLCEGAESKTAFGYSDWERWKRQALRVRIFWQKNNNDIENEMSLAKERYKGFLEDGKLNPKSSYQDMEFRLDRPMCSDRQIPNFFFHSQLDFSHQTRSGHAKTDRSRRG